MAKYKVLFFDYWTSGLHNFRRLTDEIHSSGGEFELVHLGSLRDGTVNRDVTIDGIRCRDISAFRGDGVIDIIRKLGPSVVVSLNMCLIPDRALFIACRRFGVPVAYLQHGAVLEPEALAGARAANDRQWNAVDYLSRVRKYATVIPWYLRAKDEIFPGRTSRRVLTQTIRHPTLSAVRPLASEELWPDVALVYSRTDADTLLRDWGMDETRVRIVGNPELDAAFQRRLSPLNATQKEEVKRALGLDPKRPVVLHADEGWTAIGAFGWNPTAAATMLRELCSVADRVGAQVLIRPKPAGKNVPGPFASFDIADVCRDIPGVAVSRARSVCDSLDVSDVVVGMMSTVLESAVVLGVPILTPSWFLQGKPELSAYVKYGSARAIADGDELASAIRESIGHRVTEISPEFAARRLGPLDGCSVSRIVGEIKKLAEQSRIQGLAV